jgi:outer membrane lipoprotein SlyB
MKTACVGVCVVLGALAAGCTFPSSGRLVSRQQVGHVQRLDYGTVQKVSPVVIGGERSILGLYGGGAVGGAGAGAVGQGTGRDLAQAGGAVAGAVVGQAVEEAATRKDGIELIVKLDNGSLVTVTQPATPTFAVGDRVAVANGPGGGRVIAP